MSCRTVAALLLALLLAGCTCSRGAGGPGAGGRAAEVKPLQREAPVSETPCLETLTIDRHHSYLDEVRGRHQTPLRDFVEGFAAEAITAEGHVPMACAAQFTVAGKPLFFFSRARKLPVLDGALFSELAVGDATRLAPGERRELGRFLGEGGALSGRQLALFLLHAGAVQTFWHIEARLCLAREEAPADGPYRAHFRGSHIYFTNERNEDPLAFVVELRPDGAIWLEGAK